MNLGGIIASIRRCLDEFLLIPVERDPGVDFEISMARGELWQESQLARRQAEREAEFPIKLELEGIKIRSQSAIKPSCRKCHGRGWVGVLHWRVREKQPIDKRQLALCSCIGRWIRVS